jgi:hypothetical protein
MNLDERFELLWTDFLEGDLDADGMAELQSLLAQHSHLHERATDLLQTHRLLGFVGQEERTSGEVFAREVLNRLPKTGEAFVGAVMRAVNPSSPSRSRFPWLSWRPLTAAAAGIVLGMLCTSMVFGFGVVRSLGKAVTLLEESFESHSVKLWSDFPSETGVWGGGVARVVQGVEGVVPPEGRRMLRVEPDLASTLTYLDRIIDLSSLPLPAAGEVRYVEVTASFHAGAAGLRNRYTLRAAAFGEAPGSLRQLWLKAPWRELEERALAGAKRGLSTDADTTGWHKITVRVEAPPEARSLVISLAAGLFETPDLKTAHYIDDVCAHLVMTPSTTHPRHRRR